MQNIYNIPQPIKITPMITRDGQDSLQFTLIHGIVVCLLFMTHMATQTYGAELPQSHDTKGLSTLNIRLSSKIIRPPQELVTATFNIPSIDIARPIVGPPSKSAILEDDQRHRMVILTTEDNGELTAYMLENIDLTPHLQDLRERAFNRGCARDRMSITGGLGCVALCLKELIESEILP